MESRSLDETFLYYKVFQVKCIKPDFFGFLDSQSAVSDGSTTKVLLGSATAGGGFALFGQFLVEVIDAMGPDLRVEVVGREQIQLKAVFVVYPNPGMFVVLRDLP